MLAPQHLIEHVKVVVPHAYAALEMDGVKTNCSPDNTEILALFNGPDSRAQRAKWLTDDKPFVPVQLPDRQLVEVLPTQNCSVHLGNVVHHMGIKRSDVSNIRQHRMLSQIVLKPL